MRLGGGRVGLESLVGGAVLMAYFLCSAISQLMLVSGWASIGKFVQAAALVYYFGLVVYKFVLGKVSREIALSICLILVLFVGLLRSIAVGIPAKFVFISFMQMSMFYFWVVVFETLSVKYVKAAMRCVSALVFFALVFAAVEFLTPAAFRVGVLGGLFPEGIPGAYYSRELGFLRLGSFFLSPLTFAYACVLLICWLGAGRVFKFSQVMAVLSFVKTGYLGVVAVSAAKRVPALLKLLFLIAVFLIFFVPFFYSGHDILLLPNDALLKSTSNHFVGLVSGVSSAYENVIFGNGLGTAGYVIYLETLRYFDSPSPFSDVSPFLNGNESTVGVVGYQLGFMFLMAHVYFLVRYFNRFNQAGNVSGVAFVFFLLIFQIMSESSLTIFISSTSAALLVYLRRCRTLDSTL